MHAVCPQNVMLILAKELCRQTRDVLKYSPKQDFQLESTH